MDTGVSQGRELKPIDRFTDTREILARATRLAEQRKFDDVLIVDIDSHVNDAVSWGTVVEFIEDPVLREAAKSFGRGSGQGAFMNGAPGLQYQSVFGRVEHGAYIDEATEDNGVPRDVILAQRSMDAMKLDYQIWFPNALLYLGLHPQLEMECVLATAYNRWLVEHVLPHDKRLRALLYLPFNTPEEAEKTVKRFLGAPGVAGFLVTSSRHKPVHSNQYMRLYAMLEEAGQPLAFHAHHNWNDEYTSQLNRFISMHAISFVLCNMVHLTNWVINGLPERFPDLKVVWMESGLAWLPFLMQRLDNEYLMRSSEAPLLKKLPSEYMREMYYSSQPMETTDMDLLAATFRAIRAETQLLYSSDWPHWDFDLPSKIWDLPFLEEEAKKNILGLSAKRVFNLD